MSVLVVDDNDDLRMLIKLILSEFEIIEARNGLEAIELFRNHNPNLILMDILMPEMDGIEATREILSINPSTLIVAITAYSSRAHEILDAGAKEVLKKPVRNKELLSKVRYYLNK